MHTVKREPLRSLSSPQPSSKNHFPTKDRATFDFRPALVCTRETKKEHYRIIDFGKELNHGSGQLESSTAVDYRAIVKKKFLASFRWSWFRLGTIILAARIVVELQISFPHISYSIISRKVLLSIPNEAASHRIGYQFEAPGTVYGRTYSEKIFLIRKSSHVGLACHVQVILEWHIHIPSHRRVFKQTNVHIQGAVGSVWETARETPAESWILDPYIPL